MTETETWLAAKTVFVTRMDLEKGERVVRLRIAITWSFGSLGHLSLFLLELPSAHLEAKQTVSTVPLALAGSMMPSTRHYEAEYTTLRGRASLLICYRAVVSTKSVMRDGWYCGVSC